MTVRSGFPASPVMTRRPQSQRPAGLKIAHLPRVNTITDEQMHLLEKRFGVKAREGWLD